MSDDLALLGVVIEERGVDSTISRLDALAASGTNAERSTQGLTKAQAELVARSQAVIAAANTVNVRSAEATAKIVTQASEVRALAQMFGGLAEAEQNAAAAIETLNTRTRQSAAAMAAVQGANSTATTGAAAVTKQTAALGQATGLTNAGLNSMRASLTSMAAAALGTAPGVAQLTGVLGTMAVGSGVMVGVLAGVAALTAAWEYFTRKQREAKEAADAFAKTDLGLAARNRAGQIEASVSGGRPGVRLDVSAPTKELEEARKALSGFRDELNTDFSSRLDRVRLTHLGDFAELNRQLVTLRREFASGRISIDQYEHGLSEIDRAFPGFEKEILESRELGETFDAAAKAARRLAAETSNAAAEARALIAAHGQPGTSFEQGGQAAVRLAEQRKALDDAQLRAAAAAAGGAFAVRDLDNQNEAIEKATASWKEYVVATGNAALANVSYAQALSQHNAVAEEFLRNAQAQIAASQQVARTLAVQAEVVRGTGEIEKLRALNGAYRESELALRVLAIQLDATNQKRQNKLQYEGADLARVNGLVDATARERIQQALLSDQLERENRLRATRNANAGALETAVNARSRAGMTGPDAEMQAIRDRAQEEIDAAQRAHDAITGLTRAQQATEDAITREKIANIRAVETADIERIQRARQEATRESVNATVRDTDAQTAGLQAMIAAELAGGRAVEQMRVQLAGNEAVQRALNDATARGTTITQEQANELRRSAEELEQARINAEKLRAVFQEVRGAANQFFTDVFNRKNPLPGLAENIKRQVIGALSDAVARPLTVKIGKILGIEPPEDKQLKASRDMNTAADKMLRAAQIYAGQTPSGGSPPGVVIPAPPQSAAIEQFKRAMGIAGAGLGGYGAGYGIGQMTGSGVLGAIGGAAAGAKMGAAFGAPGVVVGALAGLAGGIIGAGDAAAEAAAKLEEARKVFQRNWDSIVAEIRGDDLAGAIAAAGDKFDQLRQQYIQTITVSGVLNGSFQDNYRKIDELQKQYVEMLKQEAAAKARSQIESYRERELRAEGKTAEADALHAKEERQELIDSFGKEIDATERQILASYDAAAAAEKNAAAVNALTTTMRNAPSGFKLEGYVQEFAKGRPFPVPQTPYVPPYLPPGGLTPYAPPRFSQTGTVATAPVHFNFAQGAIQINGTNLTEDQIASLFLRKLDGVKERALGMNATRAAALERMPS